VKEFPIFTEVKVHYHAHNSLPLIPILSQVTHSPKPRFLCKQISFSSTFSNEVDISFNMQTRATWTSAQHTLLLLTPFYFILASSKLA
jgi:hypothetical protein